MTHFLRFCLGLFLLSASALLLVVAYLVWSTL